MKKLQNKVAVITGGNSGMGLSTAVLFAEEGAKVAITGRNQTTLDSAVKSIGNGAIGIASDVSDLKNIVSAFEQVNEKLGKIDVLIVNAGIFLAAPLADFTEEQFDQTTDVNFKGAFFSVQTPEDFSVDPLRNKLNVLISRTAHESYHRGQIVFLEKREVVL